MKFNLQRFDATVADGQVTIPAGETYVADGVTFTAGSSGATLNLDDDEKISGISSGSVTATTPNSNAKITFDTSDGAIDFTATASDKIITVKQRFPIEFIGGDFTYRGNKLTVSAGSTLAIVSISGNYSLRNENTFVYGGTYTFTNTAMTTDSQHTISNFTLTNGSDVRQLQLEQFGKVINNFSERGFTLVKGSSEVFKLDNYTLTATATNDAALNIALDAKGASLVPRQGDGTLAITLTRGDTTVLEGELECTSGEITFGYDNSVTFAKDTSFTFTQGDYVLSATTTDTASASVALTGDGISFTPDTDDGGLTIVLTRSGTAIFDSSVNVTGGTITFNPATQKISLTEGTKIQLGIRNEELGIEVVGSDASFKVEADGAGNFKITPDEGDGSLDITLKQGGQTVFYNNISVSGGSIVIGNMGQTIGLTKGTTVNVTLGNYTIAATADADASFQLGIQSDGSIAITPAEGDGKLDIAISRDGTQIFSNKVSVNSGTITFNPTTQAITLKNGTEISLTFGDNELVATANGDATSVMSLTGSGIAITPNTGDGSLDLSLKTSSGSLSANIEVLSGSFILGDGGALTVTKDTELQIDFGDGYIVNFKATDEAGGSLSLGADGITFTPGSDDGGLELSITRDGETRTASLDVTGSVTYKLDGSISLTKDTVVKNVFADGNTLTITATTDASGKIIFAPNDGLTITPSTPNSLDVLLSRDGTDVIEIAGINGSVNYKGGTFTASDGTELYFVDPAGNYNDNVLRTSGGSTSLNFNADGIIYTANEGATFVMDYLQGTTWNLQNGAITDHFSGLLQGLLSLSAGSTFVTNDNEFPFTLEKEGNYMLNGIKVTTSSELVDVQLTDYDTVSFPWDADVKVSSDGNAFMLSGNDDRVQVKVLENAAVTSGSVTYDNATKKLSVAQGTTVAITRDGQVSTITAHDNISATYKLDDGISYFTLDNNASANLSVNTDGQTVFSGDLTVGGVISYSPNSKTFGLTGANSSHGNGENTFAQFDINGYEFKMSTNDTTVVFVPEISDGKISLNFPNERKDEMLFTISKDGNTLLDNQLIISGTIGLDIASKEVSLTKGTVLTIIGDHENSLEITALDDASGNLTFTDDGIRFAPNAGDGQLELNFVTTDRKANIDVSAGALILKADGTLALEKDTVLNLTWEDGTQLTMTASDTGGAIGFDAQGLKISSDGELSIDLTAGDLQTTLSNINGTIHYNAGKVLFDENSTLTATSTLGGQPVDITLDSNGTGGYLEVSASGTNYVAGTGALTITWSRDGKSSTFSVTGGSVYIGHGIFQIAEGTELSTDLKDLVPALYFTTSEAGTYVINGQTVTTSAANISMTATDNQMTFSLREGDEVSVNDMTFTGAGNVIITADAVTVGDGITATGFDKGDTFVLYQKGSVTVDEKIFELTEDVPTGISVTGADDGFIFSRITTAESEERLGIKDSPDIGKIFTEKFVAASDGSYRVQTDLLGLQQIIGISDGASVTASATFDGEISPTLFDIVTDTTGTFTVGKKPYAIGGDSSVAIKVEFESENKSYVRGFDSLDGTAGGDFTAHAVSLDGTASIKIFGDTDVVISNSANGVELFNLSDGAQLADTGGASKAHTDTDGSFIFGEGNSIGVTVQSSSLVTFEFDLETQFVTNIANVEGTLRFTDTSNMCSINGIGGVFSGEFSSIGAYDNLLYLHDVADGSSFTTPDADKIWLQQVGASMALNENTFDLTNDANGIWIRNREIVGLDEGASLQVSKAGTYSVNAQTFTARAGDIFVGLDDGTDAYIYDANNPLITKNTPTEEIVDRFKPENISIVAADDVYPADISLSGGDLAVVENTSARVNITAGDDTVVSQGKNVHVSLTGGNTWLFPTGGKMTLEGYDASTGSGFGTTFTDVLTALQNGQLAFSDGKLILGSAQIVGTDGEIVNFFDRTGNLQKVAFADQWDSINAGNSADNLILSGNAHSTLMAGSGNDTILASQGSFVDGGEGKNFIELSTDRDTSDAGTTINVTNGNNTIANFKSGFEYSGDLLANSDENWFSAFDGTNVTVETDNGKTILSNIGDGESFVKIKISEGDKFYNMAIAQKNSVIAAGDEIANIYIGDNSGVDFTGFGNPLMVNLGSTTSVTGGDEILFVGINQVTAGDGNTTIIGSDANETLTAGNGYGSLWGAAGNDKLVGKAGSDAKNGRSSFFFFGGDGEDTVSNFEFLTRENRFSGNADKIAVTADLVTRGRISGDDVVMQLNFGDDYLTLEDARGKDFRLNEYIVKVDENISYDGLANCYVADGGSSLTVESTVDSAEIWLDSSHGTLFFGDTRTLDASAVEGRTSLVGNALDNTIIAGHGDSSLWGGEFLSDDLLIGGAGKNTFFYHIGNGNDTIQGAKEGDIVDLNTLTIDQVVGEIGEGGVVLNFTDGGSLTVTGTDVEFKINNDGTTYVVEDGHWTTK